MLKIYELLKGMQEKINGTVFVYFHISEEGFLVISICWKEGLVVNERFDPVEITMSKGDERIWIEHVITKANEIYRQSTSQNSRTL